MTATHIHSRSGFNLFVFYTLRAVSERGQMRDASPTRVRSFLFPRPYLQKGNQTNSRSGINNILTASGMTLGERLI